MTVSIILSTLTDAQVMTLFQDLTALVTNGQEHLTALHCDSAHMDGWFVQAQWHDQNLRIPVQWVAAIWEGEKAPAPLGFVQAKTAD